MDGKPGYSNRYTNQEIIDPYNEKEHAKKSRNSESWHVLQVRRTFFSLGVRKLGLASLLQADIGYTSGIIIDREHRLVSNLT